MARAVSAHSLSRRSLAWLLIAAALALRALVPAGWMPTAHPDGLRIGLCSEGGPQFVVLGPDGRVHREAPPPVQPRDSCPFGLSAAQAVDVPPAIHLPLPPVLPADFAFSVVSSPGFLAWRALPPPARGPPPFA